MVSLNALKANLDASLALFADVVLQPSFPAADFERLKKQQLAAIEQEMVQPMGIAMRVVPGLVFGRSHAYGAPLPPETAPGDVRRAVQEAGVEAWSARLGGRG